MRGAKKPSGPVRARRTNSARLHGLLFSGIARWGCWEPLRLRNGCARNRRHNRRARGGFVPPDAPMGQERTATEESILDRLVRSTDPSEHFLHGFRRRAEFLPNTIKPASSYPRTHSLLNHSTFPSGVARFFPRLPLTPSNEKGDSYRGRENPATPDWNVERSSWDSAGRAWDGEQSSQHRLVSVSACR